MTRMKWQRLLRKLRSGPGAWERLTDEEKRMVRLLPLPYAEVSWMSAWDREEYFRDRDPKDYYADP